MQVAACYYIINLEATLLLVAWLLTQPILCYKKHATIFNARAFTVQLEDYIIYRISSVICAFTHFCNVIFVHGCRIFSVDDGLHCRAQLSWSKLVRGLVHQKQRCWTCWEFLPSLMVWLLKRSMMMVVCWILTSLTSQTIKLELRSCRYGGNVGIGFMVNFYKLLVWQLIAIYIVQL